MHPPDQQNSEQTTEARTDARPPQPNSPPKGQSRFPRQGNRPRPRLRSEAFAGLGLVAAEIFRYNRQNFAFDQDQRFNRDELRFKMQVERFRLFRQDIRDLVELTVGKMDLYHMVGALFIRMISIYYSEGFFAEPPPTFLQVAYYLSQACALVYLLMAIWLSMHASIKSHSYATRLLTRFVRLPIPGCDQINLLNARYADFEKQGGQMLRVPFFVRGDNRWEERTEQVTGAASMASTASSTASDAGGAGGNAGAKASDELENGEYAYGGDSDMLGREQELLEAVEFRTHRHVQIFRQLQARWQCFDAYARVCMSFGVRHMLQSINYYLLGLCMVQLYVPHVGFVLTLVFQALAVNITILDVHSLPCWGTFDLSFIGFLPALIACAALFLATRAKEALVEENFYPASVAIYPLEIAWFELLHWVASPSSNESSTPRHFRAVLFMDVFGDAEDPLTGGSLTRGADPAEVLAEVQLSFEAFRVAQCCLRRWEEVPGDWLPLSQKREVNQFSDYLRLETDAFADLLLEIGSEMQVDNRSWTQLSQDERLVEPCSGTVLGPFYYSRGSETHIFYWDIENTSDTGKYKLLFTSPGAMRVLTLDETLKAVRKFQQLISHVHRISGVKSVAKPEPAGAPKSGPDTPRAAAISGAFTQKETKELYKPIRLPWRAVSCLTRTTQLMWLGVGFIAAFRETDMMRFDFQVSYIVEERRLQESDELVFEELPVQWPYGSFFRIEALRCMENSTIAAGGLGCRQLCLARREGSRRHRASARDGTGGREVLWTDWMPGLCADA
ncbi:unnamed protein product [Durusdinium trenchii]|uniref:Autophagy-related protein 9 n=1 Tax=Durusdinium trenchii TaxID=1381693 RepID=A0ABP0MA80_9DINO